MYQYAIIGCGDAAHWHAKEIKAIGQIVAICDNNEERAIAFHKEYGGNIYISIDDLLNNEKEVDIIVICSPTGMHAEHAIKSLQAGKHVLCERPLCITNAAAWQIIETARLCRRKLGIVSTLYNSELYQQLESLNEIQKLGKPISFQLITSVQADVNSIDDWKSKSFPGGNSLLTYFHDQMELVSRVFGNITVSSTFLLNSFNNDTDFEIAGTSSLISERNILGTISWTLGKDIEPMSILNVNFEKGNRSFSCFDLNCNIKEDKTAFIESTFKNDSESNYKELYSSFSKSLTESKIQPTDPTDLLVIGFIEKIYSSVPKSEEQ